MLPYSWWILGIGTKIFPIGHFPTQSIFFIFGHSCSFLFMMVSLVFSILPNYSEVFDWLSKLILDDPRSLLWFCFTSPCDWSVWFIQPIKCKTKTILTWSLAFSRASSRLPVFTLSFYWLMMMFIFALICSCDEGLKKTFVLEFFTMLNVKITRGGNRKNINNFTLITVMKYHVMVKQTHQLLFMLEN